MNLLDQNWRQRTWLWLKLNYNNNMISDGLYIRIYR